MKKLVLLIFVLVAFQSIQAQEKPMSIDLQAGLPLGDAEDITNFNVGLNFTYLFTEVAENFHLGARTGFSSFTNAFTNSTLGDGARSFYFANASLVTRYDFTDKLFGRFDLGYMMEVDDNFDGGLFYEPRVGYLINNVEAYIFSTYYL